ncbi:hypothetical protein [Paenarthrobacter nicotinovorans]|uniref:hypothetical protein n=1 Tax=Paenarthrobacter nicotinovorans TaxID=29320 RepID=UPI003DA5D106
MESGEEVAEGWTYYDDIHVTCSYEIDLADALSRLQLPGDASLGAVLIARCSGTPIVQTSGVEIVRTGFQQLSFTVPAEQLAGTLSLEFQISSAQTLTFGVNAISPHKLGHTVFRMDRRLILEGTAPRLPMLPVRFSEYDLQDSQESLWWLKLMTKDLHASAASAIWLWMNIENQSVQAMLDNPDASESGVWLKFLKIDFARQLLREALDHEELTLSEGYPEASLGHALSGVVRLLGETVEYVRARYNDDPGRVEAQLQAKVGDS